MSAAHDGAGEDREVPLQQDAQSGGRGDASASTEQQQAVQKSLEVSADEAPGSKQHSSNSTRAAGSRVREGGDGGGGGSEDAPDSGGETTGPPSAVGSPSSAAQPKANGGSDPSRGESAPPQQSVSVTVPVPGTARAPAPPAAPSPKSRFGYVAPATTESMMLKLRKMNKDLHDAAKYNDRTQVEFLAKRKANLNDMTQGDGLTPIMRASECGHLGLVQFFIRLGANANLNTEPEFGRESAIFKAAKARRTSVVAELMANHVDRDCKTVDGWTPLMAAVDNLDVATIMVLLERGVIVSKSNRKGETALQIAASKGSATCARLLIEAGFGQMDARDNNGVNALMKAAEQNHSSVCQLLIESKARVNLKCDDGRTPLMRAASVAGSETVRLLLLKKADPNLRDSDGWTALHYACCEGGSSTVVRILLLGGADVNAVDEDAGSCLHRLGQKPSGSVVDTISEVLAWPNVSVADTHDYEEQTPLLYALTTACDLSQADEQSVMARDLCQAALRLLHHKASVNAKDPNGRSPLMLAASLPGDGDPTLVKALLTRNSKVLEKDMQDQGARELAMEVAPYSAVIKILKDAEFKAVQNRIVELARAGDVRSLQAFMKERGPDSDLLPGCSVDAVSSSAKRTALMVAAQAGKVEMIRHLAEQGASINEQDGSGFTALMLAVSANSAAATEELLENDANVNIKTWSGMTALMLAAERGHTQALGRLLDLVEWNPWVDLGGDLDLQNNQGDTALMLAVASNHPQCVEMLLDKGADLRLRRKQPKFKVRLTIGGKDVLATIDATEEAQRIDEVVKAEAAEAEQRRLKRLQLEKEYAVPAPSENDDGGGGQSENVEIADSPTLEQGETDPGNQQGTHSEVASEGDDNGSQQLSSAEAAEARRRPDQRGLARGPPRGVTVMEIAAALNDGGEMLEMLATTAKIRVMQEKAAVLQANEDAAKIMQARRDAYEKMRAEEAERQAQVDAEAARQRKKEELLKEKMRRRLEREKTKALKEQEQKAAEMQRLAEEREADAKFDAAAGF